MNKRLVVKLLGIILLIEALTMVPSLIIALCYGDGDAPAMGHSIAILAVAGLPMWKLVHPSDDNLRIRDGFAVVALGWLLLSVFGCLPFIFSRFLPNPIDALFEAVSGFTTTGATVVTDFSYMPHGVAFWRSFTHWIGGMGVLVLTLALLPRLTGHSSHLARVESPGPSFSKIVPRLSDSSKILYAIYAGITALLFIALLICGLNPYDAALHAVGTTGTGGFSNYADSIGHFGSTAVEIVFTVFMLLSSLNFALYFKILTGSWREALKDEELHWFGSLYAISVLAITLIILPQYGNFFTALRYSTFHLASVLSTTGFATTDFSLWPQAARMLVFLLLFLGGCAGSTAGGLKTIRLVLLSKMTRRNLAATFQPRKVQTILLNGKSVEENILTQVAILFFTYIGLVLVGAFLLSFENQYGFTTHLTAALTCVSNVGPGLDAVGPAGSFAGYGAFSKLICCILMLCGRLEIFPMLVLIHPALWRKG